MIRVEKCQLDRSRHGHGGQFYRRPCHLAKQARRFHARANLGGTSRAGRHRRVL